MVRRTWAPQAYGDEPAADHHDRASLKTRRKKAGWNTPYLGKVLRDECLSSTSVSAVALLLSDSNSVQVDGKTHQVVQWFRAYERV
jgi:hypothetical protein